VQVSFDIDANGLLQVAATDRTTGRQQSVSIQGGTNLSEEEINRLLLEAEQKAAEDRRKRSEIDRRNRAQTLVSQAERRLRDAALELGPYGAERQQRSVELALRDVQDLLRSDDTAELELAVSQLQEALFGLNRRLFSERRAEAGPLQGIKNTLGSLRDELFADDDWDEWDRDGRSDPWASTPRRPAAERTEGYRYETRFDSRWDASPSPPYGLGSAGVPAGRDRLEGPARDDWNDAASDWDDAGSFREIRPDSVSRPPSAWRTGAGDEVQRRGSGPDRDGDGDPDGAWTRRSEAGLNRRPSPSPQPEPEPDDPWSNG
jgi:hypothetical protein